MEFFTSDLHLDHEKILKYSPYRNDNFYSIQQMNDWFIASINDTVGRNDELWILGDFCWGSGKVGHFRQRIQCRRVHFIYGNHDNKSAGRHFSTADTTSVIRRQNTRIHLSHFPLVEWSGMYHGSIHLYGHAHSTLEERLDAAFPGRRSIDVGMDNAFRLLREWRPFSLKELLRYFE